MLKDKITFLYKKYLIDNLIINRFARIFSVDILVKIVPFLLLPLYLQLMTQDEFGLYGYIIAFVGSISLVFNFGLYLAQSKLYHDYEGEERRALLFTISLLLFLFIGIIIILIVFFKLDYHLVPYLFTKPIPYDDYRNFILLAIIATVLSFMLTNFFITSESIKKLQVYNIIRIICINGIPLLIMFLSKGDQVKNRLEFTYVAETLVWLVFSIFYFKNMKPTINLKIIPKIFKLSIPAFISALVGVLYNFSDRFVLEKYVDFSEIAIYNLAIVVASVITLISQTFNNAWLPLFFKEKNISENYKKTKKTAMIMCVIYLTLSAGLYLLTYLILEFKIIDIKYWNVLLILPIILIVKLLEAMNSFLSLYFSYFEAIYVATVFGVVSSVLMLGLNYYFIPRFNIIGAGISLLIVACLSFMAYLAFIKIMVKKRSQLQIIKKEDVTYD